MDRDTRHASHASPPAAMTLLAAGVDVTVIALWLGHEHVQTTQIYLHGDLTMKPRALAHRPTEHAARPLPTARPSRAFLEAL